MTWHVLTDTKGHPDIAQGAFAAPQAGTVEISDEQYASLKAERAQAQLPDWDGFNGWILVDQDFNAVYGQAIANGAIAKANALFVAYAQVASGSTQMFATAFNAVCEAGGATAQARMQWATQAKAMHLPATFCQLIKGNHE